MLSLDGTATRDGAHELEPAPPEAHALRQLDLAAYGFDRAPEHRHWSGAARPTLWLRAGEPAAYSYAWPSGRIGPVAGADPHAAAAALRAELALRAGDRAVVVAPGSSAPLVAAALASGLRMRGPPGLLLVAQPERPPDSLAIASYTLF
jgi:hypothetical protein